MKSKRKWLAGILSVVMTMTFMPAYAFAGEAAEGGAGADATWTVKRDYGKGEVVGNYNDIREAIEQATEECEIILNRDASGKGLYLEAVEDGDSWDRNFDFNGHTYTVTGGAKRETGETESYAIGNYSGYTFSFDNGTLKIENCSGGIRSAGIDMTNFNVDASNSKDCKNAVYAEMRCDIDGNSSVKVQPVNDALNYYKFSGNDNVINTKGTIQGNINFFGSTDNLSDCSRVLIRNGRFDGKIKNAQSVISDEEGNEERFTHLKLYGGSFSEQPDEAYIAKGYEVKATDDGRYVVDAADPLLKKIKELREEVAEADDSLDADINVTNKNMYDIRESLDAAEESLNDGVYEDGVEKATLRAEKSIQEAKAQIEDVTLFITQKGKEYSEKGQTLKDKCADLRKELKEVDRSQYDFGDFDVDEGLDSIEESAQKMLTIFSSTDEKDYNGFDELYLVELNKLNKRLTSVEVKLDKVKKLPNKVNKENSAALEEARKELEETKKALAETEKKQEELNKKLDVLAAELQKTQEQLKKAEEELKKQNNAPTPSSTVTPVKKPGQVKGLKLKAGKKKVTVTYKKVSGATSYKVTYSTSKKFKKAKTVTMTSGKTVKKTISKLKSKKTYYVKVCAVKKVKGKNFTGKWSGVKSVKVK